jgi:hypothetical protein
MKVVYRDLKWTPNWGQFDIGCYGDDGLRCRIAVFPRARLQLPERQLNPGLQE